MWQRFTERARQVVFYAQEEAQRFKEGHVSTEQLLLGLTREENCVAADVLRRLGTSLPAVRADLEQHLPHGRAPTGMEMTITPRAKRVIDLSYLEARTLGNDFTGTEHLLLGIIVACNGLASRVLIRHGVRLEAARKAVWEVHDAIAELPITEANPDPPAT